MRDNNAELLVLVIRGQTHILPEIWSKIEACDSDSVQPFTASRELLLKFIPNVLPILAILNKEMGIIIFRQLSAELLIEDLTDQSFK